MKLYKLIIPALFILLAVAVSCENGRSYADLLNDESKYVNKFLVNHKVVGSVPADSVFEVGVDAPYYQLDEDGNIYMQVLVMGTGAKVKKGQRVYFRFERYNLSYYSGPDFDWNNYGEGNATDLTQADAFFVYDDFTLPSSSSWGSGIQMPLAYLPYGSEVNIVIKSQYGITDETSQVQPYLYNVRYFPSQI